MNARSTKHVTAIRLIEKSEFVSEVMEHLDVVELYIGRDYVKVNDQYVGMGGYYVIEDEVGMDYNEFHKNYDPC